MLSLRAVGQNHIYLDENLDGFSNVAVGLLLRAIGHSLKVAYVDVSGTSRKFVNFLENLSLNSKFVKSFDRLHIETFILKGDKISKGIIPSVEFNNISKEMFWNELNNFDLVIFDNSNLDQISEFKILNYLKSRSLTTESVFVFSNKLDFEKVKNNFDLISIFDYKKIAPFKTEKNIINITGNGKGKSTYSFGFIVRQFLNKCDIKLVYFDKGGNFYGERVFFNALKEWSKLNTFYGKFDYVACGKQRFDGHKFRFENTSGDFSEACEALMLLKTALKKQTPVIADELNTMVNSKLLKIEDIMDVLINCSTQFLITGRNSPKSIIEICDTLIEVLEVKHYISSDQPVRKGIDF